MNRVTALDLSDAGVVVGMADYASDQHPELGPTDPSYLAFKMRQPGNEADPGVELLRPLDGTYNSIAHAINESGWVVGLSNDFDSSKATLWLDDGTPYDLNMLTAGLPDDLWLEAATGVNDHGQIVALATDGFSDYPVLLTPAVPLVTPEPAACTIVMMAAAELMLRRRRQA